MILITLHIEVFIKCFVFKLSPYILVLILLGYKKNGRKIIKLTFYSHWYLLYAKAYHATWTLAKLWSAPQTHFIIQEFNWIELPTYQKNHTPISNSISITTTRWHFIFTYLHRKSCFIWSNQQNSNFEQISIYLRKLT